MRLNYQEFGSSLEEEVLDIVELLPCHRENENGIIRAVFYNIRGITSSYLALSICLTISKDIPAKVLIPHQAQKLWLSFQFSGFSPSTNLFDFDAVGMLSPFASIAKPKKLAVCLLGKAKTGL